MPAKKVDVQAFFAIPIAFSVVDGLAILLTLARLSFRLQIRRLWWEDLWAAVAAACGMIFIAALLVSTETADVHSANASEWLVTTSFTSTVWAVRMSLLYSTLRIISPSSFLRKVVHTLPYVFTLPWACLIVLKIWWCNTDSNVVSIPPLESVQSLCILPDSVILFELIADFVSDAALAIIPLKLLWKVKLPRRQRRMILCLFSSSAFISAASLFHATCQLVGVSTQIIGYISFELELATALIVCDLLVIVTYLYRVILSSPDGSLPSESETNDDDFTTRTPALLTTLDLNTINVTTTNSDSNLRAVS